LQAWPGVAAAFDEGSLDAAQVETIARGVARSHVELFADHDTEIPPMLVGLSVRDTSTAIEEWDACADAVCSRDPAAMEDEAAVPEREAMASTPPTTSSGSWPPDPSP
jgi:hypothetical protein